MPESHEVFTRWGLIIAAMGMAVGTGNVWRFPRVFATNEGGAFLIPWLIFLFAWSIPLLILEVGMGKKARKGVVGAFAILIGPRYTWMGGFVALVTVCIMFYYSVVTGWCLRYFLAALTGGLNGLDDPEIAQQAFQSFASSGWPLFFHLCAIGCGSWVIYRGVSRGIERVNKILIPMLALLLIIAALRAITLPGAERGLQFMFHIHWASLVNYNLWIEALTQSAWSTGAGWGLLLTYAVYAREHEDSVRNSLIIGLGNNSMSIIAGLAIIPTVFAAFPTFEEAFAVATYRGPASTGLTFVWIPILFGKIPFGSLFSVIFFLALSAAALSSLIAMIELATRICMDFGLSRRRAVIAVASVAFLGGVPSALSLDFLANQDWAWGLGLMVSGGIFAFAAIKYGLDRVRKDLINLPGNELNLGSWFNKVLGMLVPFEMVIMLSWWIVKSFGFADRWYDPFSTFSLGTCLFQWGLVAIILLLLNDRMNQWILRD
jgi:NSS family neurotransmitter:Na+ symporter